MSTHPSRVITCEEKKNRKQSVFNFYEQDHMGFVESKTKT